MSSGEVRLPFAEEPVPEIPLARSPLVVVMFQVRFPGDVQAFRDHRSELTRELAQQFPVSAEEFEIELILSPGRPPTQVQGKNSTFALTTGDGNRTLRIASDSISLTALDYTSRSDLIETLREALTSISKVVDVPPCTRIGLRYLNRVLGPNLGEWISTLTEGTRGVLAASGGIDRSLILSLSQAAFAVPENPGTGLQSRWGLLPPNMAIDASMDPVPEQSWILDIDSFEERRRDFDAADICDASEAMAARSYRFFRWVVNQNSLERFN